MSEQEWPLPSPTFTRLWLFISTGPLEASHSKFTQIVSLFWLFTFIILCNFKLPDISCNCYIQSLSAIITAVTQEFLIHFSSGKFMRLRGSVLVLRIFTCIKSLCCKLEAASHWKKEVSFCDSSNFYSSWFLWLFWDFYFLSYFLEKIPYMEMEYFKIHSNFHERSTIFWLVVQWKYAWPISILNGL